MSWIELVLATLAASLIGSLHCVGMCGPFTMIAISQRPGEDTRWWRKVTGYHLGRLTTYLLLGTVAGLIGAAFNLTGNRLGLSHTAAWVVGGTMIGLGVMRGIQLCLRRSSAIVHSSWIQAWSQGIMAVGRRLQPRSPVRRAYVIGLITTWLPCGWLYVFALAASGAGSVLHADLMMLAFWVGTLPMLSLVGLGTHTLQHRANRMATAPHGWGRIVTPNGLQGVAAGLMIAFGGYTLLHRSSIQFDPRGHVLPELEQTRGTLTATTIHSLVDQPLPCCASGAKKDTELGQQPIK